MFQLPDTFVVEPLQSDDTALKSAFGMELATKTPFEAACLVCGKDTSKALFIVQNWLNDPIVIEARDKQKESAASNVTLLDKDQLAAKLLRMAEEKDRNNTFYLLEGKDRLKALDLYAEIKGYKDKKTDIPPVLLNNQMVIKLVEAEKKEPKTIDQNSEPQIQNINSPVKLKLVSSGAS